MRQHCERFFVLTGGIFQPSAIHAHLFWLPSPACAWLRRRQRRFLRMRVGAAWYDGFVLLSRGVGLYSPAPMAATLYDLLPRDEVISNDVLLGRFLEYAEGQAAHALSRAGIGHPRVVRGEERHSEHAHRLGQIARGRGAALQGHRPGQALDLHLPDQGAGEREMAGAVPRVRPGQRRPEHRRRLGESRRADPLLHRRNPRQHRLARRRGRPTCRT